MNKLAMLTLMLASCTKLTPEDHATIAKDAATIAACQAKGLACKQAKGLDCYGVYDACMRENGFR